MNELIRTSQSKDMTMVWKKGRKIMLEKRRARDMLKMKDTNYFVQVSGYVFSLSQLRHYIICSIRMSVTPMTLCHLSPNLFPKVANNASSVAYSITLILLPRGRR